ncbi:uncharacterized protein BDFB_006202, partial [Asbolus verrucosus]
MARISCSPFKWSGLISLHFFETSPLSKIRLYSSTPVRKIEIATPTYNKTDHEHKTSKKVIAQTLENLLGIRTFAAVQIISKNKIFRKVSSAAIKNNHAVFLQKSISSEILLKHPELLAVVNVEPKLLEIQKLPYDINTVAVLLLVPFNTLVNLVHNELKVGKEQDRLNDARRYNIDSMKTWMVRVQPEIFQNYIQRRSDNKSILGNSSLTEYLSERLECSNDISNYLIVKQPALKNKSLKKLKELIDFLFAAGFKSHHICRVPKILVHSVDTIQKRLKQLEDKGIQIDSLHMLTKSQKQFTQYYEALL